MAIQGTLHDLETQKFVESPTRPGYAAVEVTGTLDVEIPSPVGGATEAKQDEQIAILESIDGKLDSPIQVDAEVTGIVSVDNFPAVQPTSVAVLPLPTGASTEAKQDVGNTSTASIDSKTPALVSGKTPVVGPLTDTELRATAVPVSGPLTDTQLRATAVPVSGPLTDTQLRATPVPISGTLALSGTVENKEKPDATSGYSPSNIFSTAYEASHIIKNSAGTLYSIVGYNSKTSGQFIQLHNSTTLPADTAVPEVIFWVDGQSNFNYSSDKFGRFFSTGIVVCNSSTGPTKIIGAADCWFDVQYS